MLVEVPYEEIEQAVATTTKRVSVIGLVALLALVAIMLILVERLTRRLGTLATALEFAKEGADLVLCMSIHPGYSGQAYMPEATERIRELRSALPPGVRLQVDGGINGETIGHARTAGADLLVAGSAIFWRDDPAAAYRELSESVALGGVT